MIKTSLDQSYHYLNQLLQTERELLIQKIQEKIWRHPFWERSRSMCFRGVSLNRRGLNVLKMSSPSSDKVNPSIHFSIYLYILVIYPSNNLFIHLSIYSSIRVQQVRRHHQKTVIPQIEQSKTKIHQCQVVVWDQGTMVSLPQ